MSLFGVEPDMIMNINKLIRKTKDTSEYYAKLDTQVDKYRKLKIKEIKSKILSKKKVTKLLREHGENNGETLSNMPRNLKKKK